MVIGKTIIDMLWLMVLVKTIGFHFRLQMIVIIAPFRRKGGVYRKAFYLTFPILKWSHMSNSFAERRDFIYCERLTVLFIISDGLRTD